MHTTIHKIDNQQGAQYFVITYKGKEYEKIYMYA